MKRSLLLFSALLLSILLTSCTFSFTGGEGASATAASTAPMTTTAPVTTTAPMTTTAPTVETPPEVIPAEPPLAGIIKRADGITVDGLLDAAYFGSASIASRHQDPGYVTDPGLAVDPTEAIGMKTIYRGSAVEKAPDTACTLYLLWGEEEGEPYLYIAAVIYDETPLVRSDAYMAHPNPWLTDAIEISYRLGGEDIPTIPKGEDTYPTYHNILVDAREKSVSDHSEAAPNHTAVAAQRSLYFDRIESATARLSPNLYVVEVKLPAYTESHTGKPGSDLVREVGEPLAAGDLVFLCIELLDLTYLPEGYDDALPTEAKYKDEWSYSPLGAWAPFENDLLPYIVSAGNRNASYLAAEGTGPAAFRLSAMYAE